MFKNYLKIAVRSLLKFKVYSFINIFGLSVAIACCILILLFVQNELSYDSFHVNKDRIYQVYTQRLSSNGEIRNSSYVPMPFASTLSSEFDEIEAAARFYTTTAVIRSHNHLVREEVLFTDPTFFDIFSFSLKSGNRYRSLLDGYSIVLSEKISEKYFSDNNPIGQVISMSLNEQSLDFVVTGVLQNSPENSTIKYDFVAPFERLYDLSSGALERATSWNSHNNNVFVLINQDVQLSTLESRLPTFANKYFDPPREIKLQPLSDVHLNPSIDSGWLEPVSYPLYSYLLGGIAAIVLLIACVNFMTISIGQFSSRTGEIGMRKVMGAQRTQLMKQFLTESVFMSFLALFLGGFLAKFFLPTFNDFTEKSLNLDFTSNMSTLLILTLLTIIIGLIAGSFPSLVMSRFQPIEIFRNKIKLGGGKNFGKVMVVLQFSLSIFLIITTIIMTKQKNFLITKNLGYNQEQVVVIPTIKSGEGFNILEVFKNELATESRVVNISGSGFSFDRGYHRVGFRHQDKAMDAFEYRVDFNYLSLLDLKLLQGRDFSKDFKTDPDQAAIVNETFVKKIGWENPVGQSFNFRGRQLTVIGIVKDYHFQSLHSSIQPVILHLDTNVPIRYLLAKIQPNDIPGSIEVLKSKWKMLAADTPFEFYFLDNDVARQYQAEQRWNNIITYSSIIAIVIACLGLFGLSSLTVTRRTKEIGVRKVMGASIPGLVGLINKEFLILVLLGNLVAWPIAYFVMDHWLQTFAYQSQLSIFSFLLAAFAAFVIALLTVSYQSIKAALLNPVETLRYE